MRRSHSFKNILGLDFDPVTGNLCDTGNGRDFGQEIDVKPRSKYQLVSHMKLNNWATQSHVAWEGFNQSSKQWYEIKRCPSGINGPQIGRNSTVLLQFQKTRPK
jgi:hypothetical protein